MSYWVLTATSEVMSLMTVSKVTNLEHEPTEVKQQQEEFSKAIAPRLGNE